MKKKSIIIFILSLFPFTYMINIIYTGIFKNDIIIENNNILQQANYFVTEINQSHIEPFISDFNYGKSKSAFKLSDNININHLSSVLNQQNYKKSNDNALYFTKDKYIFILKKFKTNNYLIIEKDTLINAFFPFIDFYIYIYFGKSFGLYLNLIFPFVFYVPILSYCYYSMLIYKK